jgi:hypothetical protein
MNQKLFQFLSARQMGRQLFEVAAISPACRAVARLAARVTRQLRCRFLAGLALALFCASCQAAASGTNAVPIATLALYDGGTLWGGREFYILTNGVCVTRVIRPPKAHEAGMQERRCKVQLERTDLDTLRKLLNEHHFFTLTVKDRPGVPDETRTTIYVRLASGQKRDVSKWTRDPDQDFDAIYQHLLRLVERVQKTQPVYEGGSVYRWKPEGFE